MPQWRRLYGRAVVQRHVLGQQQLSQRRVRAGSVRCRVLGSQQLSRRRMRELVRVRRDVHGQPELQRHRGVHVPRVQERPRLHERTDGLPQLSVTSPAPYARP